MVSKVNGKGGVGPVRQGRDKQKRNYYPTRNDSSSASQRSNAVDLHRSNSWDSDSSSKSRSRSHYSKNKDPDFTAKIHGRPRFGYQDLYEQIAKKQGMVNLSDNQRPDGLSKYKIRSVKEKDSYFLEYRKTDSGYTQHHDINHKVQYVALEKVHDERVLYERGLGEKRRNSSASLLTAFRNSVRDVTNLEILTQEEHKAHGPHKTRDQLQPSVLAAANTLFDGHLNTLDRSSKTYKDFKKNFELGFRPMQAYPKNTEMVQRRSTRKPAKKTDGSNDREPKFKR